MNIPVIVTESFGVIRYNVRVCMQEDFTKASIEVEDLIINAIKNVYSDCAEYGYKPSYVVVACNEGTFIMKQAANSCFSMDETPSLIGPVGITVETKTYAHNFALLIKKLAEAINNNPNFRLEFSFKTN